MRTVLDVEPAEYYPFMDKLFISKLGDALDALGLALLDASVEVSPEGRTLYLDFAVRVSGETFVPMNEEEAVRGILERLVEGANSSFGRTYPVRFEIRRLNVEKVKEERPQAKLIVNGPDEELEDLRRIGKGLAIALGELGVNFSTLTVNMPAGSPKTLKLVLKSPRELSNADREALSEFLRGKAISFMESILGSAYPVEVRVIDPRDKTMARALLGEKSGKEIAEELVKDEDVRMLLSLLGKKPPGS